MPKLQVRKASSFNYTECKRLKSLTMRKGGTMCYDFDYARAQFPEDAKVIMLTEGDKLLSWALVFPVSQNRIMDFEIYTRKSERRKGYGKLIYVRAKRLAGAKPLRVHPHDGPSTGFFKAVHYR